MDSGARAAIRTRSVPAFTTIIRLHLACNDTVFCICLILLLFIDVVFEIVSLENDPFHKLLTDIIFIVL